MGAEEITGAEEVTGARTAARQRLVIVAPTTVEFDSRTRRIAAGIAARGHAVTVIARRAPGLA